MTWIISLVEKISDDWFSFIVNSSVQLAIFLTIIGIIGFIFRKKSARFLYFLWLIGLARVFLPSNLDFFFKHSTISAVKPDFIPTIQIQEIVLLPPAEPGNQLGTQSYFFLFWLAGAMVFMSYWLFNYIRFRRIIKRDVKPFELSNDLAEIIKNTGVTVLTGKFIATPFVRGLFRPKIYLPEHANRWNRRELKAILYHELAHVQCKDLFLIIIQNAVQMVYFFHPLVWLANMQIFRYREKARDDLAIEKMGGNALAYGKYLLTSMDNAMEWQPMYSASHYFLQSKSFLYQRFEYILNRKEKIMNRLTNLQKGVLAGCLILGLVLTIFQSNIRSQTKVEQKPRIMTINVRDQQGQLVTKQEIINGRKITFETFDKPPEPVGGFSAIKEKLIFPTDARKAGKEGRVLVYTHIGSDGKIIDAFVGLSTIQDSSCEAAALKAVKSVDWNPAMRQGKPIAVWVKVPVSFTLNKTNPQIKVEKPTSELPPSPLLLAVPDDSGKVFFVPYDKPPFPVGGFAAIQRNLRYPESARKAKVEGTVILYVFINENGEVERTKIMKSLGGNSECDAAAIEAIKSVKWEPARQRDKKVGVWIAVPVKFKLSSWTSSDELKDVERKLRKVESDLKRKEELLQKMLDEKSAKELKKIREELKRIQEKLNEKSKQLKKMDESLKEKSIAPQEKPGEQPSDSMQVGNEIFVPYDEPPIPIGGFEAIQRNLIYPEDALKAKVQGTVILLVQISEKGEIGKVRVKKTLGGNCDQAAIDAVKSIKWKPAKVKGKPVAVWVSVPVRF